MRIIISESTEGRIAKTIRSLKIMPPPREVLKWVSTSVITVVLYGILVFYCGLHLVFKMPVAQLIEPLLVFSAFVFFTCPVIFWAREKLVAGYVAIFSCVIGVYGMVLLAIGVLYASRLGFLSFTDARFYLLLLLPAWSLSMGLGYLIWSRVGTKRRRKMDTQG